MKTEVKLITPEIAKSILSVTHKNRVVRTKKVNLFAYDMTVGKWKAETGEAIKISREGYLLDGQHRLLAIIQSNKSIPLLIISDLDDSIMDVLDTGTPRNAGDVFRFNGIKNDRWLSTMIKSYLLLNGGFKNAAVSSQECYLTNTDILNEYYKRESFWNEAFKFCQSWYNSFGKVLSPSILGGVYGILYNINAQHSVEFMDFLCDGINLTRSHPIYLLRNKLMNDKASKLHNMPHWIKLALIYKTWNYYRKGIEPRILKFTAGFDEFPRLV